MTWSSKSPWIHLGEEDDGRCLFVLSLVRGGTRVKAKDEGNTRLAEEGAIGFRLAGEGGASPGSITTLGISVEDPNQRSESNMMRVFQKYDTGRKITKFGMCPNNRGAMGWQAKKLFDVPANRDTDVDVGILFSQKLGAVDKCLSLNTPLCFLFVRCCQGGVVTGEEERDNFWGRVVRIF